MGDFNVDLESNDEKADRLLELTESCSLGPVVPESNTSLRSERTIHYAVAAGVELTMQTYEDYTSSDHKPLIAILTYDTKENIERSQKNWSVFSLMLSYTVDF